jgi:amino-acid N-acetyltransferase
LELIRKAIIKDAKPIFTLVESFANKGVMLPRPLTDIYSSIRDFFVYEEDGELLGAVALHVCWEDLAEVRSLVVRDGATGEGIGTELLQAVIKEARDIGSRKLFALTYTPGFFEKFDFKVIDKDALPHKIWGECVKCMKFPNCDETAVMLEL